MNNRSIELISVEELAMEDLPESAAASTGGTLSCFSSIGGSGATASSLSSFGS
ncbi:thiocillin family RiPP [Herbiconiux sp. P16]|uniref:thiocillin family RiPP n=1 Tax=Herbiconiux wuyangfengii TaxID=3342794 RepID=UPI0035BA6EFE